MTAVSKAREHAWKFLHPEGLDGSGSRVFSMMCVWVMVQTELQIYLYLQESTNAGNLPHYITDVLIVGMFTLEVILAPFLCHTGARKRRSVMLGWTVASFVAAIVMLFLPSSEPTSDDAFCNANLVIPDGISTTTAIRLTILIIAGLVNGLGRTAMAGQGLAYVEARVPSVNVNMNVGILVLFRVMGYVAGKVIVGSAGSMPWLQILLIVTQYLTVLIGLFRYSDGAPNMDKGQSDNGGLFRSMGRVLGNCVVLLQIISMALMTAAWWGFGYHRASFVQIRYNMKLEDDSEVVFGHMVKHSPIVLGVLLAGYMYTRPVMTKFDKVAAAQNAARNVMRMMLLFSLLTAMWGCDHSNVAGAGETYIQPACAQNCGCERPWTEYTPVCEPGQMQTYFSPCHAGCGSEITVNKVAMYSNCTCAPGGRVIIGACDDGTCALYFFLHQMMYVLLATLGALALSWQISVVLESIDKRDVGVAVGLVSSFIALFTFVGAHIGYQMMSSSTCILSHDDKCLLHHERFAPLLGYTSGGLAALSFLLGIVVVIMLRRSTKKEKTPESVEVTEMS